MLKIQRYLFTEILGFFFLSLLTFTGWLLTIKMLKLAGLIINKGVGFLDIATVFAAIVPSFLEIAIPLATLLGVLLAVSRLSGDSELVVLKASGVSLKAFLKPTIIFAILAALFTFLSSAYIRPYGNRVLSNTLLEIAKVKTTSGLTQGVFNKLGPLTVYSDNIDDQTGELQKVLIDDTRIEGERKIIVARRGQIASDPVNERLLLFLYEGAIHEHQQNRYSVTKFDTNQISLDPDELFANQSKATDRKTREMYPDELRTSIDYWNSKQLAGIKEETTAPTSPDEKPKVRSVKKELRKFRLELGREFSMPFACLVLALAALPLGVQPPRLQKAWGVTLALITALAMFVIYYGLLSVGIALSQSGKLPTFWALWLPNIVTFLFAALFIRQIATERWGSITDGFISLASKLRSVFPGRKN